SDSHGRSARRKVRRGRGRIECGRRSVDGLPLGLATLRESPDRALPAPGCCQTPSDGLALIGMGVSLERALLFQRASNAQLNATRYCGGSLDRETSRSKCEADPVPPRLHRQCHLETLPLHLISIAAYSMASTFSVNDRSNAQDDNR